MSRNGGEMSNFTTCMTPRYSARTIGCRLAGLADGRAWLRKQNKCDCRKAKQNAE